MKIKSLEDFVSYGIQAEVVKLLAKCISILAYVKPLLVKEHAGLWVLQVIKYDIIELTVSDCIA